MKRMAGDLPRLDIPPMEGPSSLPFMTPPRKFNGRTSPTSPLKVFGQAKKKINDIFVDISNYVRESTEFLEGNLVSNFVLYPIRPRIHKHIFQGIDPNEEIVSAEQVVNVAKHIDRVRGIREMIGRNRMKVAFFGR